MKFEEVLPELRQRKEIRLKDGWDYSFRLVDGEIHRFNYVGHRVVLEDLEWGAVLNDRWEIVEKGTGDE